MLKYSFKSWKLYPVEADMRQFDNLTVPLVIEGAPAGWTWNFYLRHGENYDLIPLTEGEDGTLSYTLTADNLAFSGEYEIQLTANNGTIRKNCIPVIFVVPESIDGNGHWPELPTAFTDAVHDAQEARDATIVYAENANVDADRAEAAAETAEGYATTTVAASAAAAESERRARNSEISAAASESTAATSAQDAAYYKSLAALYAEQTTADVTTTGNNAIITNEAAATASASAARASEAQAKAEAAAARAEALDSELIDIRTGADGTVYSTAGDAVRGQVSGLTESKTDKSAFENLQDKTIFIEHNISGVAYPYSECPGFLHNDGTFRDNRYVAKFARIPVTPGKRFAFRTRASSSAVPVAYYTDNGDLLSVETTFSSSNLITYTVPENAVTAIFASFRGSTDPDSRAIFELYYIDSFYNDLTQKLNKPKTLNDVNQLFATLTMGQDKPVQTLDKGVVCIGFDDYNADQLEAVQYLVSEGLPCYLSVIPDKVTDAWVMAKLCYENGGEIVAHSSTPLTSENQTFTVMNEKFVNIPHIIADNGFPCYGIIRAGGTGQGTEDKYLDEYFCRSAGLKYSDYYGISSQYNLERKNITRETRAEMQTRLDNVATNKGFEILFCHHVDGTEDPSGKFPGGFTMNDFRNFVADVKARDIDVMTINQFVDRYVYGISPTDGFIR